MNNNQRNFTDKKGFALLEIIVAIVIMVILALVLFMMFSHGIVISKKNRNRLKALHLVSGFLDRTVQQFSASYTETSNKFSNDLGPRSYEGLLDPNQNINEIVLRKENSGEQIVTIPKENGKYRVEIKITPINPVLGQNNICKEILVTVNWNDDGVQHKVDLGATVYDLNF